MPPPPLLRKIDVQLTGIAGFESVILSRAALVPTVFLPPLSVSDAPPTLFLSLSIFPHLPAAGRCGVLGGWGAEQTLGFVWGL